MPLELRKWLASYLLFAAISANSFFFVKVAVQSLEPLQISFARVAIGAATLIVFLVATGKRLPTDRKLWGYFAVAAIFQSTLPFTLYGYGVQHVSSVHAAIWKSNDTAISAASRSGPSDRNGDSPQKSADCSSVSWAR